eukprot:TRINITY_DN11291_c0_g6_i1.p1 TRINITY_DN11291_c0_g6~~TRINITY_DN11291_c0_g6_i1.p1  ORF type:complete len:507 (+),score=22.22 TRINITY_DN11291_c0_g6_i1:67-1587(+)
METYSSLEQGHSEDDHAPCTTIDHGRAILDQRTRLADPELLRGAPFSTVVAGFGRLFDPEGTIAASSGVVSKEDTFIYSRRVDVLHHFLSHSWRDSGKLKWLSLLFYLNFSSAMFLGHLFAAIAFAIVYVMPHIYPVPGVTIPGTAETGMPDVRYRFGPFSMVCMFVSMGSVFFAHQITRKKADLFLDKVCIHQTDLDMKTEGIKALGAFLKKSQQLLVLWGDDYFDRLWCSYELALYIRLRGTSAVQIIPIDSAAYLIVLGLTLSYVGFAFMILDSGLSLSILMLPALLPYIFIGVYKAKVYEARERLRTMLLDYDVRKTSCFCCQVNHVSPDGHTMPCDRTFVEESIAAWYGDGTQDGLDNFNEIMRTQVNEDTATILGKETVAPLSFLILISSQTAWIGIGQGLINPWNSYRFKVGTILEASFFPFYFVLIDALTGIIMRKLWQCNSRGNWFRCWTGLVFCFFFTLVSDCDIVFLNENIPLWIPAVVAPSIIVCGLAARHFAP